MPSNDRFGLPDRFGVRRGVEHIPLRGQREDELGRIISPPVRTDRSERSSEEGASDDDS